MIRIMLADDHTILRHALCAVLEREADVQVVAEVSNGAEALSKAREVSPDLVIMDISMPGINGIEATRRLITEHSGIRVLALSTHCDLRIMQQIMSAGAEGYVVKSSAGVELLKGIRTVMAGQRYLCPEVIKLMAAHANDPVLKGADAGNEVLSKREYQVLSLLAEGKTSPEIAGKLFIAVSTVEVHRRNIMRKLQIHSVAELTKYAIREGLTSV